MPFKGYWQGRYPKRKREFYAGEFVKRKQARNRCLNYTWLPELTIVIPDGSEERYAQ